MYIDANSLYKWAMSQRLNGFEWTEQLSEFDEHFLKNYDENNDKGCILEVDVEYPKNLPERKKIEKCRKLLCNIHNKEN